MDEAYRMAEDCLGLMLSYYKDEGKQLPRPSSLKNIKSKYPNEIVKLVESKIMKPNELKTMLSQWDGVYNEKEVDWGKPQGREI